MQDTQTPLDLEASASINLTKLYKRITDALPGGIALDDDPYATLHVSRDMFETLHDKLWQNGLKLRCSYDDYTNLMTVLNGPTVIHETTGFFFYQIVEAASDLVTARSGGKVEVFAAGKTIQRLVNPDRPNHHIDTMPSGSAYVDFPGKAESPLPGFAMETGYSRSYKKLVEAARLWLLGSHNEVNGVLLVKLQKPKLGEEFGDINCWEAYLEVWVRGTSDPGPAKESGSPAGDISANNLPVRGEDPTGDRLIHTEEGFDKSGILSEVGEQSEHAADPADSGDESSEAPSEVEIFAPSDDEDPSTSTIKAKGIIRSGDRVYFLRPRPQEPVLPEDLEFELRIADIIGKNVPDVGNETLKISLKQVVRHVKHAIRMMAPEVERKATEEGALKKRKADDNQGFKVEDDETSIKRHKNQC